MADDLIALGAGIILADDILAPTPDARQRCLLPLLVVVANAAGRKRNR